MFTLKYAALLMLVAQNTFLVILMRVSRTAEGNMYASSTAVAIMECLKFITCLGVILYEQNLNLKNAIQVIKEEVIDKPSELLKLGVPSVLYVIQNNLLYYALSHLDAATYLVGYQSKIITTAIFATFMLGRKLTTLQWISLLLLTVGVSLAQLHASSSSPSTSGTPINQNSASGFIAVLLAACTSGFSGIYFEKILKGSKTSLWLRNIQMGLSSIFIAFIGVYFQDGSQVYEKGFFFGYTKIVWAVVLLQALGGLVVAVVVKYADNILKGFAASFSIVTSCIICYFFLDFQPSIAFVLGSCLVLLSSYMYEKGLPNFLSFLKIRIPVSRKYFFGRHFS